MAYLLLPMTFLAIPLWLGRARLVLSCLAWTMVMLVRSPFVQLWHSYYLIPLLAASGLGERPAGRSRVFVLLAYLVLASIAFSYFPFNGTLLLDLAKELFADR
jgi:hypothetical protein